MNIISTDSALQIGPILTDAQDDKKHVQEMTDSLRNLSKAGEEFFQYVKHHFPPDSAVFKAHADAIFNYADEFAGIDTRYGSSVPLMKEYRLSILNVRNYVRAFEHYYYDHKGQWNDDTYNRFQTYGQKIAADANVLAQRMDEDNK